MNPSAARLLAAVMFVAIAGSAPAFGAEAESMPEVLDLDAAAALMHVEPAVVRALAEKQAVPARRVGEQWRFARDALLEWLKGERYAGMAIVPPGRSAASEQTHAVQSAQTHSDSGAPPASIGERPAASTAAEVALRDQRVLIARGAASLDFGVSYARSEHTLYPVLRAEQNAVGASATLRYGLRDELQLTARLPGVYQRSVTYADASVAVGVQQVSKHDNYLGDMSISLLGAAAREAVGRPNLVWSVDGVVPSGPGDSGIGGGMVLSKSYDPVVLFAGANYLYGLSTNPYDPRRGLAKHNLGLNLGYTFALNDTIALNAVLNGVYRTTRSPDGAAPPPARERYQLQFGATWMLAKGIFLEPAVGVRLGGDSPDMMFSLNLPYSL